MSTLLLDLRFAVRTLRRRSGFTLAVVLTLALGIGANSAIFSVVNAVLLRPLPFPQPERLVRAWGVHPNVGQEVASLPDFRDWRAEQSAVALAAAHAVSLNLTGAGEPQRVEGARVSANFLGVLGAPPSLGRDFTREEETTGRGQVVMLTQAFWRRQLGASPDVVGRTLTLDGLPHTVVGVAPASLEVIFPRAGLLVPLAVDRTMPRRADFLSVFGRLAPGVPLERAQAELGALAQRLAETYPNTNARWSVELEDLHAQLTQAARPALLLFLCAVALVLLIACANVANLLLAQGAARERELAVRAALGAGRGRLVRQLLTESLLLSGVGGLLGLVLAAWGVDLLELARPAALRGVDLGGLDLRAVLFTLALSLVTGLLFGLVPALRLSGEARLRQAAGGPGGTARRLRGALVLGEVALALMLLVGAGLLVRSFERLQRVDPGFRPDGVLTGQLSLPRTQYATEAQQAALAQRLLERVGALPGVQGAALTTHLPLSGGADYLNFGVEGRPPPPPDVMQDAETSAVSADYFRTLGIPLRAGRAFGAADLAGAPEVAVVNEALARRHFRGQDPIGARLSLDGERYFTVVGVVGDVRASKLGKEAYPQLYLPVAQRPASKLTLAVRAEAAPDVLAAALQREVAALDPQLPLAELQPMETYLAREVTAPRVNVLVLSAFAAVALVLAMLGIYGVVAYGVAQRTREIGIRMALGARGGDVQRLVVGQGIRPALFGVAVGLAGALATSHLLAGLLYGVAPTDLATFGLVSALLLGVALLATWLPARRAVRVPPTTALQAE